MRVGWPRSRGDSAVDQVALEHAGRVAVRKGSTVLLVPEDETDDA